MHSKIKWLGLCFALLLSACGTVDYMDIQTYNPAEVTFPKSVRKVLVVDNSITQPAEDGYYYEVLGEKKAGKSVQKDSAMVKAVHSLGYSMADASYFEDVLLFNDKTKSYGTAYASTELTPSQVEELCQSTDADAVISWDRLTFETKRSSSAYWEGFVEENIDIYVDGVLRAYLPDRKSPLATIHVKDSVFFNEMADNMAQMEQIMPSTDEALTLAAEYVAQKQVGNFVPHWNNETRWVYNEGTSRWREASAYVSEGKWDKAAERWKQIYAKSSGGKKAKAASNLALYYEMKTDLQSAYEWADKSYQLFEKLKVDERRNFDMQELYRKALNHRIELNTKLNLQIGAE